MHLQQRCGQEGVLQQWQGVGSRQLSVRLSSLQYHRLLHRFGDWHQKINIIIIVHINFPGYVFDLSHSCACVPVSNMAKPELIVVCVFIIATIVGVTLGG